MTSYFKSVNEIISFHYWPAKICGMAPFERLFDDEKKRYYFKARPIGLHHLLVNGGLIFYLILTAALRILTVVAGGKSYSIIEMTIGSHHVVTQLFTYSIIAIFLFKQKHFTRCLEIVQSMDQLFEERNLPINYNLVVAIGIVLFLIIYPIFMFVIVCPIWKVIYVFANGSFSSDLGKNLFLSVINYSVANSIRNFFLYFSAILLVVGTQRFKTLNDYTAICELKGYEFVNDLEKFLMKLHNLLYHLVIEFTEVFGLIIFLFISMMFFDIITMCVACQYTDVFGLPEGVTHCVISSLELLAYINICQKFTDQTKLVTRSEAQLILPYVNKSLTLMRHEFLLQLRHEKIVLTAHECYDLNMSIISSHMGMFLSLLMFLLQLREEFL